ncbi:hypothetical protein DUNSADRAFT_10868 [Dunaliella salina]|uniref:Encoded protein n=1 Tax=Dunaliella salina TaxID=3046 RepID=A0ABQ7HA11_DUNSA|nr:hypothetical protein DUNSADRAFT_10868 [Dunaliella salina]|eukprot:KAF5843693.1 hypothetical protein DUNSADRAFT_10868 [Dunaliella salina]
MTCCLELCSRSNQSWIRVPMSMNIQLKKEHDEESRRALGLGIKLDDALSRAHRAGWSQLLFECLASTFQHPFP